MSKFAKIIMIALLSLSLADCGGGNTSTTTTNTDNTQGNGNPGATTKNLTVTWTAPIKRADGSDITVDQLGGYKIYYGPAADNTPNVKIVTGGASSEATLSLTAGTYFFRISSYDIDGAEGDKTPAISTQL